jgi:hypothetical protein
VGESLASSSDVARALADDGIVSAVVDRFAGLIGLWQA